MLAKWLGRIGFAALVLGTVGGSGMTMGCAGERDPINRVQLNALPKSFFIGDNYADPSDDPSFYARSMVIDVPYGAEAEELFTNGLNAVSKIKWTIEENDLIGRISFERITGTDGQGTTPSNPTSPAPGTPLAQNDGLVVYDFSITSQFDIRRDYNASTGEENNVIVENSTDRPWNVRDYVRVDFSQNKVTAAYDFDTLSLLGVINGIDYAPAAYEVADPNDKDAPVLDIENGYFDITNKVFANPTTIDLGGGFILPSCFLPNFVIGGTFPDGNCNETEITLRNSFKRVVDTDYEPVDWDGFKFEAYGAFTTDRMGYARDYGVADTDWHRFVSRYNVWDRSHYYRDAKNMAGPVQCTADADCSGIGAAAGMSRCDTFKSKCTLPYTQRTAKAIYWHYADGSPALYYDSTREAAEEWDTAMRESVITAQYAECSRYTPDQDCVGTYHPLTGNWADEEDALYLVKEINACKRGDIPGQASDKAACAALADSIGGTRGYSDAVIALAKMDPMVVLCHSPVAQTDPAGCGKVGEVARLGDLRYHLITAIDAVQTQSPWGIMSDANDPETGEKVAASVNIWTYVNDLFSQNLVDTFRYINGELKTADITDGKYVDDWVAAAKNMNGGIMPLMGQDERDKRIAAAAQTSVESLHAARAQRQQFQQNVHGVGQNAQIQQLRQALMADMKKIKHTQASWNAPSVNAPIYQARANLVKGTPLEAEAVTPAMQQLAQSTYGTLNPGIATAATSIFQGLNPQLRRNYEHAMDAALEARGACVMNYEATAPLGYVALADILQQKFGKFNANDSPDVQFARQEKMRDYIRRRAQYGVISHEMGHSIGLRHNFVSSSDAWNFRPQYWQLRTNDKKNNAPAIDGGQTNCKADGSNGATCVGPRWQDPLTDNEKANLIWSWSQSSTMEYPGEPSQDIMALGRYDFGAARMFYGQVATVYDEARFKESQGAGIIAEDHIDDFGGLLGYKFGGFSSPIHYSQLDAVASLIQNCRTINPQDFQPPSWNQDLNGNWNPVVDGHIVSNESGQYTKCQEPKVDFVQWDAMQDSTNGDGEAVTHAVDSQKRVRVPHGFASDEWADLGNVEVYRHDNGADMYEQMQFWQAQQEVTHIFTDYRRGRTDFSLWGAFNRTLSRYHEHMRDSAKAIALYVTIARDTVALYNVAAGTNNDPQGFVADILQQVGEDNTVASSIAFDHFAHVFARAEPGEHGTLGDDDPVLRSFSDTGFANPGRTILQIPNGVTGGYGGISLGGRPIENALADNKGRDYNQDYTMNVGSYYEKAFTAMLYSESADNFISESREDFVDPRFRNVSMADVFPDGFRRFLGNNLTGDDSVKGVFVRGTGGGTGANPAPPDLDPNGFATIGMTSWWPQAGAQTCFPQGETISCFDPFSTTAPAPVSMGPVVDPQVGWDQQKFAILFTLWFLPENAQTNWTDQLHIYNLGQDSDPGFDNRIEFHSVDGTVYVAQTCGTEVTFGETVQKCIGARVLEYANQLLAKAIVTAPVVGKTATWNVPVLDASGNMQFKQATTGTGFNLVKSCDQSRDCTKLQNYVSVPKFLRQSAQWFGYIPDEGLRGIY